MRRSVFWVLALCFVLFALPLPAAGEPKEPVKAEAATPEKAQTKAKAKKKAAEAPKETPKEAPKAAPAQPTTNAAPAAKAAAVSPPATPAPAPTAKPTAIPAPPSPATPAPAPVPTQNTAPTFGSAPTAPSQTPPTPAPAAAAQASPAAAPTPPEAAKPRPSVPAAKPTPPRSATPAKAPEEPSETYLTPQSGTLVRERKEIPRRLLYINPEITLGGQYANYKKLGKLAHFTFGAGFGLTIDEVWHIRFSVLNLHETHRYTDENRTSHSYSVWFVQPTVSAYYALLHLDKQSSPVLPLDLFLGLKGGANVFRISKPMQGLKSQTDGLFGVAFLPRFYFWKRLGIAAMVEVATTDYFKNYFIAYGAAFFYDFELIGNKGE